MNTALLTRYEIDIEEVEYLRHGDKPLFARLHKPRGTGPFPLVVDLHGGAWCRGGRADDAPINEPLARTGVVVAALDFRQPPDAGYPGAMADINYAIRWLKSRAAELKLRPDRVAVQGISSGGQQAIQGALQYTDPRFNAIPLTRATNLDAKVNCLILCWPVISPIGRYRYAQKLREGGGPLADFGGRVLPSHDQYWGTEERMTEGAMGIALENGLRAELPPIIYLQGTKDIAHPRPDLDQFVATYRRLGGRVELHLFEGEGEAFVKNNPTSQNSLDCVDKIIEFVHRELD